MFAPDSGFPDAWIWIRFLWVLIVVYVTLFPRLKFTENWNMAAIIIRGAGINGVLSNFHFHFHCVSDFSRNRIRKPAEAGYGNLCMEPIWINICNLVPRIQFFKYSILFPYSQSEEGKKRFEKSKRKSIQIWSRTLCIKFSWKRRYTAKCIFGQF